MPLIRRRPLLRAAAVGGGAYAMGKRSARAQDEREQAAYDQGWQQSAASAPPPPPAPAPAAAPAATGISADDMKRLQDLGQLHDQGVLTDEEFSAQKARILGMA